MSDKAEPKISVGRMGRLERTYRILRGWSLDEKFKSIDAKTGKSVFGSPDAERPTGIEGHYKWYETDGVVFASVNGLSEAAGGQGYYTKIDDPDDKDQVAAKELVDGLGRALNFDGLIPNVCRNMLIAGFCPVEFQVDKFPEKCAAKIVHPKTVGEITPGGDRYHGVKSIKQKVNDKEVLVDGAEFAWFMNNEIANDKKGMSVIAPVESLLAIKHDTIDRLNKIVKRKLNPMAVWKSEGSIDSIKAVVEAIKPGQDIFLGNLKPSEMAKDGVVEFADIQGNIRYWEFVEYVDRLIYVALYAPNLYYWRDATQASATELTDIVMRNIDAIKRNLKRGVEAGFFRPLLDANGLEGVDVPRVIWGVPTTGVEDLEMAGIIGAAITTGMMGPTQMTRLMKMMGLDVGELGWGEAPAAKPEGAVPGEESAEILREIRGLREALSSRDDATDELIKAEIKRKVDEAMKKIVGDSG